MTQAQLNSRAKRINQQLVQHAKTFGKESATYKQLENEIKIRFNGHTHTTKSGHIAIDTGKHLQNYEHQLNLLDNPAHKVANIKKNAIELMKDEMRRAGIDEKTVKKAKFSNEQIKRTANDLSELSDFLNNKLGDYYALREEIPEINDLLNQLEQDGKKSYAELFRIKNRIMQLKDEYYSKTLTDSEVEQARQIGQQITSEDL